MVGAFGATDGEAVRSLQGVHPAPPVPQGPDPHAADWAAPQWPSATVHPHHPTPLRPPPPPHPTSPAVVAVGALVFTALPLVLTRVFEESLRHLPLPLPLYVIEIGRAHV